MATVRPEPCPQDATEDLDLDRCWYWESPSRLAEALPVIDLVLAAMAAAGYPPRDLAGMRLALDEALVNAVRHGNAGATLRASPPTS